MGQAVAALPIVGGIVSGFAQADAHGKKSDMYHMQAVVERLKEKDALVRGQFDGSRIRGRGAQVAERGQAVYAGQGLKLNTGTTAEVYATNLGAGEADSQIRLNNAVREALGFKIASINSDLAALDEQSAASWGFATAALGGATSGMQAYAAAGGNLGMTTNVKAGPGGGIGGGSYVDTNMTGASSPGVLS